MSAFCSGGETLYLTKLEANLPFSPEVDTISSKAVHYTNILEKIFWNKGQSGSLLTIPVEIRELWRIVSQTTLAFFVYLSDLVSYS